MAIFYMDVKIIGRSSGRSAVGASAYMSGEKLQSVSHSSYQSGEKLQGKGGKITHDYRRKKGVVHTEIMLPENSPSEFMDRETLWNAVEASEKRVDARLAREILVALPNEFNLEEQVEVLRAYLQEHFVKIGMIADFAIHHNTGNPHAHIMLTTRNVTLDGFGKKNRDWDKKELLLEWRKAWADTVNDMLERKGLDARIDHRSYKEQGIDRLPYIHMGHAATALERQGIQTERGDYNREIQKINETRAALMEANRKTRQKQPEIKSYTSLNAELYSLKIRCDDIQRELINLDFSDEHMDEDYKNVEAFQGRGTELRAERQTLRFLQIRRKRWIDIEIEQNEEKIRDTQRYFEKRHNIAFSDAPAEIERVRKERRLKKAELEQSEARILEINKIFDDLDPISRLTRNYGDCLIDDRLARMNRPPPKPKAPDMDRLVQIARNLDVDALTEDEFKEIIDGLYEIQIKLNKTKLKRRGIPR